MFFVSGKVGDGATADEVRAQLLQLAPRTGQKRNANSDGGGGGGGQGAAPKKAKKDSGGGSGGAAGGGGGFGSGGGTNRGPTAEKPSGKRDINIKTKGSGLAAVGGRGKIGGRKKKSKIFLLINTFQ